MIEQYAYLTDKEKELINKLNAYTNASKKCHESKAALMYIIDFITFHLVPTSMMLVVLWLSRGFMEESMMFILELIAVFAPMFSFYIHRLSITKKNGSSQALTLPFLMGFLVDGVSRDGVRHYLDNLKSQCLHEVQLMGAVKDLIADIDNATLTSLVEAASIGSVNNVHLYQALKARVSTNQ
ncbi:hypothetical protein LMH73_009875 [Vibrio splendidus]|nr:hypothetical protein [Vibrio splendidus]MCC4878463.1 hypothetical protein [Vibrio splendidus]